MKKVLGTILVFSGLGVISLILSIHPALMLGPAMVGFGIGFIVLE